MYVKVIFKDMIAIWSIVTVVKNMLFGLVFIDAMLHLISFVLIYNTDVKLAKLKTRFTRHNEKWR